METTPHNNNHNYQELKAELILDTLQRIEERIGVRFPEAGLRQVCKELLQLGHETQSIAERLKRPNWWIRISAFAAEDATKFSRFRKE